jgi:hypothetical protein
MENHWFSGSVSGKPIQPGDPKLRFFDSQLFSAKYFNRIHPMRREALAGKLAAIPTSTATQRACTPNDRLLKQGRYHRAN